MWQLAGQEFKSRLILGTAQYPSIQSLENAIRLSGTELVTVSLRRQAAGDGSRFWDRLRALNVRVLPNTAGCRTVQEAVTTAELAREIFDTPWIKLEITGDDHTLQPEPFRLVEAARVLISKNFEVFPYMTEDLVVAERLVETGCKVLMPWGSPIGSGQGILNSWALKTLRHRFPKLNLILDAGVGVPSHATQAMELGFDGVLLNSAVSQAKDPAKMANAFQHAIQAGREGYEAGLMIPQEFARPSTPVLGTPFWHLQ